MGTGPADLTGCSVADLRQAIVAGRCSVREVATAFINRIESLDHSLNAMLELNPAALDVAKRLDAKPATGDELGTLHGIPVVLKANIDTADLMATSAGSIALAQHRARRDAPLGGEASRVRCGRAWQDELERVGELPLVVVHQWLEQPGRADPESVRPRPQSVGFVERFGRGGGGTPGPLGGGYRDRWFDRLARGSQWRGRGQTHRRPGQSPRHRAHRGEHG